MSYCFISSLPGPFTSLEISKRNLTKTVSLFCRSKIYQLCLWKFYYSNIVVLAFSQTLYFLFKVRLARVIRYKPRGIYWPPAQGGSVVLADVFEKNEKKNKTMSVHRLLLIRLPRNVSDTSPKWPRDTVDHTGCCNVSQPEELGTLRPEALKNIPSCQEP